MRCCILLQALLRLGLHLFQAGAVLYGTPLLRCLHPPKPEANRSIDLKEFIPLASVDPVYFENTHYLGADKGGEKPYRLLADAMAKSGRVAIAELVRRGKEQLVLIRPYRKRLGAAYDVLRGRGAGL